MNYQVTLTTQAQADLRDIFRCIAAKLQSPQNAVGQLARLEQATSSLDRMPERFRLYDTPKWRGRNLRIMPVDNYLVFYIPDHDRAVVTILRVMYGGRDIENQLDSMK